MEPVFSAPLLIAKPVVLLILVRLVYLDILLWVELAFNVQLLTVKLVVIQTSVRPAIQAFL